MENKIMSLTDSNYTNNDIDHIENFDYLDRSITDVPNGWSSICLDDTITYYRECNISLVKNRNQLD